jgi:hypothetical protein
VLRATAARHLDDPIANGEPFLGRAAPAQADQDKRGRGSFAVEIMTLRPAITANTAERHAGIPPTEEIAACLDPPCPVAVPATVAGP